MFDSGVGGLTVVRSLLETLPHEPVLYFGDTARAPYGPRPLAEIRRFALEIVRFLVDRDVKAVVVACNSATSAAMKGIRELAPVPVVGVVKAAVRSAVAATRNGRIGVIGTEATIASGAYRRAVEKTRASVELTSAACPRFVEFVERGDTTSDELRGLAQAYVEPLRAAGVDTLILGCTHYPLLSGLLSYVMGPDVVLISSAEETARRTYQVLMKEGLLRAETSRPVHRFVASGDPGDFQRLGGLFLGPEISAVDHAVPEPERAWT